MSSKTLLFSHLQVYNLWVQKLSCFYIFKYMDYKSKNLTSFMSSSIWTTSPKIQLVCHFQVYELNVQKPNYVLHLQVYTLQVQKSFTLGSKSNFSSIKSFYYDQSFLCLQSFIDLDSWSSLSFITFSTTLYTNILSTLTFVWFIVFHSWHNMISLYFH